MKRVGQIILSALFLTLTFVGSAKAAPTLSIGSVEADAGTTTSVNLNISGAEEAYAGINARILLPDGVTVSGVSNGSLMPVSDYTVSYSLFNESNRDGVAVIGYSGTNTFGVDGDLLVLNLVVDSNVVSGEYDIEFSASSINPMINGNYAISNGDGSLSLPLLTSNGTLTIAPLDSDMDRMPDIFEDTYGLDKNDPNDASLDPDDDGLTNLEEYLTDKNPVFFDTIRPLLGTFHTSTLGKDASADVSSIFGTIFDGSGKQVVKYGSENRSDTGPGEFARLDVPTTYSLNGDGTGQIFVQGVAAPYDIALSENFDITILASVQDTTRIEAGVSVKSGNDHTNADLNGLYHLADMYRINNAGVKINAVEIGTLNFSGDGNCAASVTYSESGIGANLNRSYDCTYSANNDGTFHITTAESTVTGGIKSDDRRPSDGNERTYTAL